MMEEQKNMQAELEAELGIDTEAKNIAGFTFLGAKDLENKIEISQE
jgi:hypothetical protein